MAKTVVLIYGIVSYLIFLVSFLYVIGFLGNFVVPKSVDSGEVGPVGTALIVNLILLALFAVPHSVMARPGFKDWWTRFVSEPVERSTYVLISSLLLILLYWQWQPMTGVVWEVDNQVGSVVLWALFFLGFALVLVSSFIIDHFDLFGLRQVFLYARGQEYSHPKFREVTLYKYVRHPLLLGWIIAFWATPHMTVGHLVFAIVTTVYMLIAIQLEERDLLTAHGDAYRQYRDRVPMIIPRPPRG